MRAAILLASMLPAVATAWVLDVSTDEMTGKQGRSVSVLSTNDTKLAWPYGTIRAHLMIRHHPRYGKDIVFIAQKGQIPCRHYAPCTVLVRFDTNPPMRFSGANPSDGSSETVFIENYSKFTKALVKANMARIEVEFYNNGPRSFTFDVRDFDDSGLIAQTRAK